MERTLAFNPAQYEVINMMSCLTSEEDLISLKNVFVQFLNAKLQKELNSLWDNGTLSQDKIDAMASKHFQKSM